MRLHHLLALAALLASALGTSSTALAQGFSIDECGTMITQPFGGCTTLWESDSGLVLQDNTGSGFGGAQTGDRIRINGTYTNFCATFCAIDGCVTSMVITGCTPSGAGTPYCLGDGSATACPCGNTGAAGEGCANSSGSGASLNGTGSSSVAADDLGFDAAQLLPGQPALLFAGLNQVNGGGGTIFGDGLRCAGGSVVRLGVQVPDASGNASWGGGLAAAGGWAAGDSRNFQVWYRDPAGSPCGSAFNLTHGLGLTFAP